MKIGISLALAACALAGCVDTAPVVSAYNGNTVSIQTPGIHASSPPAPSDVALAAQTCGKRAEYASGRKISDGVVEYLFICR